MNLSQYIAALYDSQEIITMYGNFSLFKKNSSLPKHLVNTMDKEDLIVFFLKEGEWKDLGEITGYHVYQITAGTSSIYLCTMKNDIRYIVGI